VFIYQEYL